MRQSAMLLAFAASALLVKAQGDEEAPVDETPEPTTVTAPPAVMAKKFCDEDDANLRGRCTADGDTNGKCNQATFACECSEGFGPIFSGGEWSYAGCYEEKREVVTQLNYEQGECKDGKVDDKVLKALLDAASSSLQGTVESYAPLCQSINLYVKLAVPAQKVAAAQSVDLAAAVSTKLEAAAQADETLRTALAAALPTGTEPVVVLKTVKPSKLPPPRVPVDQTPVPTPVPVDEVPCVVENAFETVKVKDVCTALKCNAGYVRKQQVGQGMGAICEAEPMNPEDLTCLADGDCTTGRVCSDENKCILATPAPTKAAVSEEVSFEFKKDACMKDDDCRVNGDIGATCTLATKECTCTAGYEAMSNTVKTCVKEGAETVQLNLRVVFENGDCKTFTQTAAEETKKIIAKIVSGTVTGFVSSCGSLSLAVAVTASRQAATDLVGMSFVKLFNEELAASTNTDLKQQKAVTEALLLTYSPCANPYTARAFYDSENRCQSLVCVPGATAVKNGDNTGCVYSNIPRNTHDSDDDLSDGEWAGIAIGIVIFVLVVAAIVFFFMRSSTPEVEQQVQKETEPATV